MHAVKHIERFSAGETVRGRPSHFDREMLLEVARNLKAILTKRSRGRISLSTFISFYLPILDYPSDIIEALEKGEVNRLEAALLSRLTPERLEVEARQARSIRREVLANHLKIEGSQNSLRKRVAQLFGNETLMTTENMTAAVLEIDELLKVDENDKRHLFYEQMKEFFFALREIKAEEIDDDLLGEILDASDRLMSVLHTLHLKRKQQAQQAQAREQAQAKEKKR
ncbi:MAG TPA: hypothetical protein VJ302_27600 [Blastocatellia bacterium]|nr:hypothetical protein [Blastocatellia bacterium]